MRKGSDFRQIPRKQENLLCSSSSVLALNVFQSSGFATQTAQIIKFRTTYFGRAHQINFIHHSRTFGENALYALTEADLADCKASLRPTRAGDDHTFKRL